MKKQKKRFVLAEASLDEVNKQLKINMFVIVLLVLMLSLNAVQFMNSYNLMYAVVIIIMFFLLFIIIKSRTLLHMKKQALTD